VAAGLLSMLLGHPGFYSVVAEVNGEVAGSNVLDERSTIPGVGPVTVDPAVQNRGVGRVLRQDVTRRAADRGAPGIRLLQAAYHSRSLSLYAKHGFQVRDLLARMQGTPPTGEISGLPGQARQHCRRRGVYRCLPAGPWA
jgi:GNAT superfamily N-acetyltransferase